MQNKNLIVAFILSIFSLTIWIVLFILCGLILKFYQNYTELARLLFLYLFPIVLSILSLSFIKKVNNDSNVRVFLILTRVFSIVALVGSILNVLKIGLIFLFIAFIYGTMGSNGGGHPQEEIASVLLMVKSLKL